MDNMNLTKKKLNNKLLVIQRRYNILVEIINMSPKLRDKVKKILKHRPESFELEPIVGDLKLFNEYKEIVYVKEEEKESKK